LITKLTKKEAEGLLRSGVGFDQVIAIPTNNAVQLRAAVVDPITGRGGQIQLAVDAATVPHPKPTCPTHTSARPKVTQTPGAGRIFLDSFIVVSRVADSLQNKIAKSQWSDPLN
jgi:hypothetical protein